MPIWKIADVGMNVVLLVVADRPDRRFGGIEATHDRHFNAVLQY